MKSIREIVRNNFDSDKLIFYQSGLNIFSNEPALEPGWYFYNETGRPFGPFLSKEQTRDSLDTYVKMLNGEYPVDQIAGEWPKL